MPSLKLLLSAVFLLPTLLSAQNIKVQTGVSVWQRDGEVSDSLLSSVIKYDKQGVRISQSRLIMDSTSDISDTSFSEFDSLDRITYFITPQGEWFYDYDSLGTMVRLKAYLREDTFGIKYTPTYDSRGKLIRTTYIYDGKGPEMRQQVHYRYRKRLTITEQDFYVTREKVDKFGRVLYKKTEFKIGDRHFTDVRRYTRDKDGNVLVFTHEIDNKRVKKTAHYYKDGVELYQVEYFYNPNYTITTYFTYQYW